MTESEFKKQCDRLIKTYGQDSYPPERLALLWREFRAMSYPGFEKIVSRLIGEFERPPMLPKFREFAAAVREQEAAREKKEFQQGAQRLAESKSFADYVRGVVKDKTSEEYQTLVRVFGKERIDRVLKQSQSERAAAGGAA